MFVLLQASNDGQMYTDQDSGQCHAIADTKDIKLSPPYYNYYRVRACLAELSTHCSTPSGICSLIYLLNLFRDLSL